MRSKKLTERRREILRAIAEATAEHGYPPTVREIGAAVGLSSSSSVHFHLKALTDLGYLQRDGSLTRALRISDSGLIAETQPHEQASKVDHRTRWLPIVGEVAAGEPILAEEHYEDIVPLPDRFVPSGEAFMLRVEGDSMIEAGIHNGDYVIVSQADTADDGDIVVALMDDEATVKYLHRHNGTIELRPANERLGPTFVAPDEIQIVGRVRGILRSF